MYYVCMKHLLIPEGSDPKEIWGRVIVPSIRDKYQSMKCNMNNKIKSIYLSMRFLLEFAHTLLIVVACTNRVYCDDLYLYRWQQSRNGGNKNIMWGTLRMMRSLTFIGMITSKMEPVMVKITTERKVTTSKHRMWRQEVGDGKQWEWGIVKTRGVKKGDMHIISSNNI